MKIIKFLLLLSLLYFSNSHSLSITLKDDQPGDPATTAAPTKGSKPQVDPASAARGVPKNRSEANTNETKISNTMEANNTASEENQNVSKSKKEEGKASNQDKAVDPEPSKDQSKTTLQKNQLFSFPNTMQAPVSKNHLKDPVFTAPLLSNAFNELDPKKNIKKSEFLETIKYTMYHMTRGEAELLFTFMDSNRDDLIDHKEYDEFKTLFIMPFEACDTENKNLLNEEQFKTCFEADPRRRQISFRRRYEKKGNISTMIMDTLSTRGMPLMNVFDYILYRRAMFGWTRCQSSGKYIAKSHFKCAISLFIPTKYLTKLDSGKIYESGLNFSYDKNLIELDFVSYLRISYFAFVFSVFNEANSHNLPFLEKARFMKSIHEDKIPNNFQESEVDFLYSLTANQKVMDFPSFCFFFNLHKLFFKYSIEKPLLLVKEEFLKLLDDVNAPKHFINLIDSSNTYFTEAEYQQASLILGKQRLNENKFFSFKQDSSAGSTGTTKDNTVFSDNFSLTANTKNRECFFSIICGTDKEHLDLESYLRGFAVGSLYNKVLLMNGDATKTTPAVSPRTFLDYLPRAYEFNVPSINSSQRKNLIFYKTIPSEVKLDILAFVEIEVFMEKLAAHNFSQDTLVGEDLIKIIMKDYGMADMPDTVLDVSLKGYDSLRRRQFKAMEAFKNLITVHAAAAEIKRTHNNITARKLKTNSDPSRSFPTPDRRFLNSPMV